MNKIKESTLLPISLVSALIATAVTVGVTYQKVEAHEQKITAGEKFQQEVIDRLARIETKQDAILKSK